MNSVLPRVLLVTDADLSAGSHGAGRALVNLFSPYPAGKLLAISGNAQADFAMEGEHPVLAGAPGLPGRIVRPLRRLFGDVDATWARWRPLRGRNVVTAFDPQVIVATPVTSLGVALAEQYQASAPLVTYIMDDWFDYLSTVQFAFNSPRRTRALLRASQGWLAISPYLLDALRLATGVDRPSLIVQNPVPLGDNEPTALSAPRTGRFRVAYSGSVWPMHWDALAAVAGSVARLREGGVDIEFVLRTRDDFWRRHEADWRRWGVVDGGLVPYANLSSALGEFDLLLVAS